MDTLNYDNIFSIFYTNKHWIESESTADFIRIGIGVLWLAMVGLMFVKIKRGSVFHLNNVVLLMLGALEIFYFISMGDEAVAFMTKFYQPSEPTIMGTGLMILITLISYVILLVMIAVQFVALKRTLIDINVEYNGSFPDFRIGLYPIPFAIATVYFANWYYPVAVKWILLALLLTQLIQIGLIIYSLHRNLLATCVCTLVYIMSIGGIISSLSAYFWIVICVVAFMVLGFFMGFSPFGEFKGDYKSYMADLDRRHEKENRDWHTRKLNEGL